jgi:hypothetical protein
MSIARTLLPAALVVAFAPPVSAASPPCLPCAGVRVSAPLEAAAAIAADGSQPSGEARLYVAWRHRLGDSWGPEASEALIGVGATPWVQLLFTVPAPLLEHGAELEAQLTAAAEVARQGGGATHFQLLWEPAGDSAAAATSGRPLGGLDLEQYAFLIKRASVALTGALPEARVISQPLPAEAGVLRALYDHEVAAYLDGVGVAAPTSVSALADLRGALDDLDPGRPLILGGAPFPEPAALALVVAARHAAAGVAITLFDLPHPTPAQLAPLEVLAAELQGDLSLDPYSAPAGAAAWAFVRGSDLALRVIAEAPATDDPLVLRFSDPTLRRGERIDPISGESAPLFGLRRTAEGLEVTFQEPGAVVLIGLERPTIAELEGVAEDLVVATERQLPVAEILRRLQAFEDAQARRLEHFQAVNSTHLRFQGAGATTVEVTFQGPYFSRRGEGPDWAWETLYVNGVRWRGRRLPEIPLIQPEKAAALPLEIELAPGYRYTLRGSAVVDGRPTWVVDFRPRDSARGEEERRFQGTVWIDQEHFGRVRTRGLQLGLQGEVISNEETLHYRPVDADGVPADWEPEAYWLPLRVVGQQLLSVVNTVTVIEREVLLEGVRINAPGFAERRREVLASELTMVRDTEAGLRYLVKSGDDEDRVVKEGFDTSKLFMVGGVFWDSALDFPLPLAGIDYFSFDWRGTGSQLNVFFAGALLVANLAQPELAGSRFDGGLQAFALALPLADTFYRDGEEIPGEEVEMRPASAAVKLGRPLGSFFRLGATYNVASFDFSRTKDTAEGFLTPSDHLLHSFELEGRFSRGGYKLSFAGSVNRRSRWEPWGDGEGFDPATREFLRWQARAAKSWHLPRFQRLGVELDYVGGQDLDRFSKYQFGFFGSTRVHGYRSGRVRAEESLGAHLTYGFGVGELLRIDGVLDTAWATDEEAGLRRELLAGVGLVGSFMGPFQTLMQIDLGFPVAGPEDGFVAYLAFLKLFR